MAQFRSSPVPAHDRVAPVPVTARSSTTTWFRRFGAVLVAAVVLGAGMPTLPVLANVPTDPTVTGALLADPPEPAPVPQATGGTSQDAAAPPAPTRTRAETKVVPDPALPGLTSGDTAMTPESESKRNADGTVTTRVYQEPTFRKRADGKREKSDAALTPGSDTETSWQASNAYLPTRFGRNANKLIELDVAKGKVRLGTSDLKLKDVVPGPDGSLTYTDAARDTDLVLSTSGAGVRLQLLLKSPQAPTSFAFELSDPQGQLGRPIQHPDGSVTFTSPVDEGVVMGFDAPYAHEVKAGDPYAAGAQPGSARLQITEVKNGWRIVKSVDANWLRGKTFPILLDPRFAAGLSGAVQVAAKDCHLVGPSATAVSGPLIQDTNFCGGRNEVGYGGGAQTTGSFRRTLHRFDVSSIPDDSTITDAKLGLFMNFNFQNTTLGTSAFLGGTDWVESQATWNSSATGVRWPVVGGHPTSSALTGTNPVVIGQVPTAANGNDNGINRYYTWTVTDAARAWVNRGAVNAGVLVRMSTESNAEAKVMSFASKEDTAASSRAPYLDVTFTPPPAPQLTKTVAAATGAAAGSLTAGALSNGTATTGQSLVYTLRVTNPGPNPQTFRIVDPGSAGVRIAPASLQVHNGNPTAASACNANAACVLDATAAVTDGIRISGLDVGAGLSRFLTYTAVAVPTSERQCQSVRNAAEATGNGGRAVAAVDTVVCDRALGLENWQSYTGTTSTGPQGTAQVNVGNGNLIVQQVDSTPVQGHGRLGFTLRRTYNSQDTSLVTLPGSLGAGWLLNFGEIGESLADGVSPTALSVPRLPQALEPLALTLADRDGTRHVFTPKAPRLDPTRLVGLVRTNGAWNLPALSPEVLTTAAGTSLCVDLGYKAPPGVHLGLYRYLQITPASGGPTCVPQAGTSAVVVGFAAVRPDRFRSEYSSDGRLLRQVDASGNELRYDYDAPVSPGAALGRLLRVYEPTVCASGSPCRAYTFSYATPNQTTVTDPAGRATTYVFDRTPSADPNGATAPLAQRLLEVRNADGSVLRHTYAGVNGVTCGTATTGQLCSITDPRGATTRFTYEASDDSGPARVSAVTDRRGTRTVITYDPDRAGVTAVRGDVRRQRFSGIDSSGRVAQLADFDTRGTLGTADDVALRETRWTWDTATSGCRKPDNALDHNLCAVERRQVGGVDSTSAVATSPRQLTRFEYTANGNVLRQLRARTGVTSADDSGFDVVTTGYRAQYYLADAAGSSAFYEDRVRGGKLVDSGSGAREDRDGKPTLFSLEDRIELLSPLGNEQPASSRCATASACAAHLTEWQLDAPTAAGPDADRRTPNRRPAAGLCGPAALTGNTGLTCRATGPLIDGPGTDSRPVTLYSYDSYGQRQSMKTPLAVSRSGDTLADRYRYEYYPDGSRDLSETAAAGGWLRAVSDPDGEFVAYGYDRAGNTARTWDRGATDRAGKTTTQYPGTIEAPASSEYSETLRAPGAAGTALRAAPWRYVLSNRDALGGTTGTCVDANGNARLTRPPRGSAENTLNCASALSTPGQFDTVLDAATADDQTTAVLAPEEAARNRTTDSPDRPADPVDRKTAFEYNAFGELVRTTDPRGNARTSTYDAVGRQTASSWTRGLPSPIGPTTATAECVGGLTSGSDGLGPAGKVKCSTVTAYDGLDQVIAATDAAGARTDAEYDALGRSTRTVATRTSGVRLEDRTLYDANGRAVLVCPARQFAEGSAAGCQLGAAPAQRKWSTRLAYDPAGNTTGTEAYRETDVSFGTLSGLQPLLTKAEYDLDGNRVLTAEPNALSGATAQAPGTPSYATTTQFDLLGRATSVSRPREAGVSFTDTVLYDAVGTVRAATRQTGAASSTITAYTYDALNRPVDTVQGASTTDAASAGLYDEGAGTNARTRTFYDADGNVVATLPPRAFSNSTGRRPDGSADSTGPASVPQPDTAHLLRYDYDRNGRPTGGFKPRYDNRPGSDAANPRPGAQADDCPTSRRPADIAGVPNYPAGVGVCSSWVTYDPNGNVLTSRAGNSNGSDDRITRYTWTDDNQVSATNSPNSAGTDSSGQDCSGQAVPGRSFTCVRYDGGGRATVVRDAKGDQTVSTYNLDGTLAGTDRPDSTGPDPADPTGATSTTFRHTSSTEYDAAGNPVLTTNELGQQARTVYYADGSPAEIGDTGGATTAGSPSRGTNTTRYGYDRTGNAVTVTSPGAVGTAAASGNDRDPQFAARAEATRHLYTQDNLLLATYTPITVTAAATTFRREVLGYDAAGRKTTSRADEVSRTVAETAPFGGEPTLAGRDGGEQTFGYDPLDRLIRQTGRTPVGAASPVDEITTSYDADGNPVRMTNRSAEGSNTLAAVYYLDGLLKISTDAEGADGRHTEHTYDGQGQRVSRGDGPVPGTLAAARPTRLTTYSYSQAQELASVSDPEFGAGAVSFSYDSAGRPVSQRNPNGTEVRWQHQPDDTVSRQTLTRRTALGGTETLAAWDYRYDGLGRVVRQTMTGVAAAGGPAAPTPEVPGTLPTGNWDYTYDTAGRLASFTPQGGSASVVNYDRNGNRTSYGPSSFAYRADDSLASSTEPAAGGGSSTRSHSYMPWGGTSSDGCTGFEYDGFDRRTRAVVTAGAGTGCPSASDARYGYDAADRQRTHTSTQTTSRAPANVMTTTHFDGMSQAISISSLAGAGDSRYLLEASGSPLALSTPASGTGLDVQWLTGDGQGNLTTATSAGPEGVGGQVACAARFDPFGSAVNAKPDTACASGASQNDVWWRGGRLDAASGQYQFGARTYDPGNSNWLTPDTYRTGGSAANVGLKVDPLTRNSYAYVNGDPINATDVNGHRVDCDGNGNSRCSKPVVTSSPSTASTPVSTGPSPAEQRRVAEQQAKKAQLTAQANKDCGRFSLRCKADRAWAKTQLLAMSIDMPSVSTLVHTSLDVAGMVPGVGEVADGLNAAIYLVEGNKEMAALSMAAMVPFAGAGVAAAKLTKNFVNAAGGVKAAAREVTTAVSTKAKAAAAPVQAAATKGVQAVQAAAAKTSSAVKGRVSAARAQMGQMANRGHASAGAGDAGAQAAVNGETVATAFGRRMHATWDYGPGFQREFTLESGRRVDGINFEKREIVELKPNNPRAIRGGERQLNDYLTELNETYPGTPWTGKVVTYDR